MAKHSKAVLAVAALVLAQVPLIALVLTQEHTWGGPDHDEGAALATAPDNSVYVAGTTQSFGAGDRDAFLLKYNAAGTLVWRRTFGTGPTEPGFRADEFAQAGSGPGATTATLPTPLLSRPTACTSPAARAPTTSHRAMRSCSSSRRRASSNGI